MSTYVLRQQRYLFLQIELPIMFLVFVLPLFVIEVDTRPVWKVEVFKQYPEIVQLRYLQWTQKKLVRIPIGKLYTTNLNTAIMSEDDVHLQRILTDMITNTTTYLETKEAAYYIFSVLSLTLDKVMAFDLGSETNAFEDAMMRRKDAFEPLKNQLDLIASEFLEAIASQRITLKMSVFVPKSRSEVVLKTTLGGPFTMLTLTDMSFVALTDNLLILIYHELKLKDCISFYEEMNRSDGRIYCMK